LSIGRDHDFADFLQAIEELVFTRGRVSEWHSSSHDLLGCEEPDGGRRKRFLAGRVCVSFEMKTI